MLPVTREVPGIGLSLCQQRQFWLDVFPRSFTSHSLLWEQCIHEGGPGSVMEVVGGGISMKHSVR